MVETSTGNLDSPAVQAVALNAQPEETPPKTPTASESPKAAVVEESCSSAVVRPHQNIIPAATPVPLKIKWKANPDFVSSDDLGGVPAVAHGNRTAVTLAAPWIAMTRGIEHALKGEGKPFPWAVKGLTIRRSATVVSGHPHAMKSFNCLAGCIELAYSQTLWGHFEAPTIKRTLYIETEDSEALLDARVRGLLRGFGIKSPSELPNFMYARLGPFDLVQKKEHLKQLFAHFKPDLVVLSTLQGLLGGRDWNAQDKMGPVMAAIIEMAGLIPGGLWVITHSPLNKEATRPAGTITQLANYSTALHFAKGFNEGKTCVDVKVDSKFGGEETEFCLAIEGGELPGGGTEVRSIQYLTKKPSMKGELVAEVLQEMGLNTKTAEVVTEVRSRMPYNGADVSEAYVRRIRNKMKERRKKGNGALTPGKAEL